MTTVASADLRHFSGDPSPVAPATPGQPDMWFLVLFEALIFSSYFVVYIIYRMRNPELYLQAQAGLSLEFGVVNTIIMLTSSWSMARCVQRAREGAFGAALWNVFLTILLGLLFTGLKLYEWNFKSQSGMTFTTNEYWSFYFFLTGMHLLHVLVGFVVLGVVVYQLWSPARRSRVIVETGATYWHMVDFLWVIIFALLYVMR